MFDFHDFLLLGLSISRIEGERILMLKLQQIHRQNIGEFIHRCEMGHISHLFGAFPACAL
jgi:hypothetical protein